jgi:hypothetical protein
VDLASLQLLAERTQPLLYAFGITAIVLETA